MVKEFKHNEATVYQCELCDLGYGDLETAERCEAYCNTNGSCSLEITAKAVYRPRVESMR